MMFAETAKIDQTPSAIVLDQNVQERESPSNIMMMRLILVLH